MGRSTQLQAVANEQVSTNPNMWWQVSVVVLLTVWLYSSVLFRLAVQWSRDANFSHGFLVPAFSVFVLWRNRERLRNLTSKPRSGGLWLMLGAVGVLMVGILGSELFLSRLSFVLMLAGLIVLFWGWDHLRAVRFPLLFLLLMIPLPAIVFNQLTFPLQILASKLAAGALPLLGVPVLREGNIIILPALPLEVADACSGIRSLFSLITLAVICGYTVRERRGLWAVLILAAIPIAVIANALRIIGTGLLVQYWNANKAEGFFHTFSGWLVFLISLGMLIWLLQILRSRWVSSGANVCPTTRNIHAQQPHIMHPDFPRSSCTSVHLEYTGAALNGVRFFLAIMLLASAGLFLRSRNGEDIRRHESLEAFPQQLEDWEGTNLEIPKDISEVLGAGEFLLRNYSNLSVSSSPVNLFIAYFPSQRIGDTIHSPKNCLPGAGWSPLASSKITISVPGEPPFEVNRYVVAKGAQRAIVLYWYWAHGRAIASEYRAKYYLVRDSIHLNRSDGSLIRVVRELREHENAIAAQQQMVSLIDQVMPRLEPYIPR